MLNRAGRPRSRQLANEFLQRNRYWSPPVHGGGRGRADQIDQTRLGYGVRTDSYVLTGSQALRYRRRPRLVIDAHTTGSDAGASGRRLDATRQSNRMASDAMPLLMPWRHGRSS